MYMIEIREDKLDELVENAEKMLRYGGKVMSCLDSLGGERGRMGRRSPMPDYRDDWRTERERDGYDDDREGRYGERDGRGYGGGYGGGRGRY